MSNFFAKKYIGLPSDTDYELMRPVHGLELWIYGACSNSVGEKRGNNIWL